VGITQGPPEVIQPGHPEHPDTPLDALSGKVMDVVSEFGEKTPVTFKRLSTYEPGASWILMYYGPSKTGKTFFAGTAGPRQLFINIGDGIETLMAPAFTRYNAEASRDMIMVDIREKNPQGVAEAFDMVCDAIVYALRVFPDKFDTVTLDEATAFRKYALNKATELNTEARRNQSSRTKRTEEFLKPDIGDYGTEMQMIEWFLGQYIPKFKEANKNFIMLAHERQLFQKAGKIGDDPVLRKIQPGFTGKTFPDTVPSYFDDVWHSEVVGGGNNVVYRARTAGSETEVGGARHGGIFSTVETDPNFLKMLARIKASNSLRKG
jgi:hypothetical protein